MKEEEVVETASLVKEVISFSDIRKRMLLQLALDITLMHGDVAYNGDLKVLRLDDYSIMLQCNDETTRSFSLYVVPNANDYDPNDVDDIECFSTTLDEVDFMWFLRRFASTTMLHQ